MVWKLVLCQIIFGALRVGFNFPSFSFFLRTHFAFLELQICVFSDYCNLLLLQAFFSSIISATFSFFQEFSNKCLMLLLWFSFSVFLSWFSIGTLRVVDDWSSFFFLYSLVFSFIFRGYLKPSVPSLSKMEKDFCRTVKNVEGSSKKKKSSNYYFWVVDEVKNS